MFETIHLTPNEFEQCTALLINDKKNTHGKILFTLLKDIGEATHSQEIENKWIKEAFEEYLSE